MWAPGVALALLVLLVFTYLLVGLFSIWARFARPRSAQALSCLSGFVRTLSPTLGRWVLVNKKRSPIRLISDEAYVLSFMR